MSGARKEGGKHACHALHDVADQYLVLIQATSFFHPNTDPLIPLWHHQDIFLKLNVEEAQATVEADRNKILNDIRSTIGIEAMNQVGACKDELAIGRCSHIQ